MTPGFSPKTRCPCSLATPTTSKLAGSTALSRKRSDFGRSGPTSQTGFVALGSKDADYKWVNKIRDGFISIKQFAMDAWKIVSGGNAVDFKWLNTARDYVVAFAKRFQEAFEMLQGS